MDHLGTAILIVLLLYGMGRLSRKNERRVEGILDKIKTLFFGKQA